MSRVYEAEIDQKEFEEAMGDIVASQDYEMTQLAEENEKLREENAELKRKIELYISYIGSMERVRDGLDPETES